MPRTIFLDPAPIRREPISKETAKAMGWQKKTGKKRAGKKKKVAKGMMDEQALLAMVFTPKSSTP